MNKLPQDYINFIARGIVSHLGLEGMELKEEYTEEDLMCIFECKTNEELYKKIEKIEEDSMIALGLPIKDSYSLEEIEKALNLKEGELQNLKSSFESFPKI